MKLLIISLACLIGILLIEIGIPLFKIQTKPEPCTICTKTLPISRTVDGQEVWFKCVDAAIALDEKCVMREGR